jgi:hypothetical protein
MGARRLGGSAPGRVRGADAQERSANLRRYDPTAYESMGIT